MIYIILFLVTAGIPIVKLIMGGIILFVLLGLFIYRKETW